MAGVVLSRPGDTVTIAGGAYPENVSLIGAGGNVVIPDGEHVKLVNE